MGIIIIMDKEVQITVDSLADGISLKVHGPFFTTHLVLYMYIDKYSFNRSIEQNIIPKETNGLNIG